MYSPAQRVISALPIFFLQFFVLLGVFFLLSTLTTHSAEAQATSASKNNVYTNVETDVPQDAHNYYQASMIEFSSALVCQLIGIDPIRPSTPCLGINPINQKIGFLPSQDSSDKNTLPAIGGVAGFATNLIALTYVPPATTRQSIDYFARNFGINKSYAQQSALNDGSGFVGLAAVQGLYIKTRNIVYLLLTILFVVIGIAIMIRVKIDPRTVMTIQNQIPKIIIAILLVTFSFSIAGGLIDVMWTITYFSINTMTSGMPGCSGNKVNVDVNTSGVSFTSPETKPPLGAVATRDILNNPVAFVTDIFGDETGCFGSFDGITGLALDVGKTFGDTLSRIFLTMFGLDAKLSGCEATWYKPWQYVTDSACIKVGFFGLLKYLVGIITFLIISIALVVNLFKIWFTLLKAYISIIIAIILAPFWIIVGVLPGGGLGFAQWVRHMVSHLAAYPAAACMLILASILAQNNNSNTPGNNVFLPPLIGNPNIADNMGIIAAFAVIMLTPDILNMVRDALKTPQGKYTGNITGRAKSGNPVGLLGAAGQYGYYMSGLTHGPVGGLIGKIRGKPEYKPEHGSHATS